jgi:uncharacterized protein YneR
MPFDIFMIAYGEANAAENWARLRAIAPEARLIENIAGIYEAYAACAAASGTPYFFAVDADNWLHDDFRFEIPFEPREDEVASWGSINPINGLSYGHGSIKLFPKALFARKPENVGLDLTMSLGKRYRFVDIPASEHRFNTDPGTTWCVAFRECVKLAMMMREDNPRGRAWARKRLETWCTTGATGSFAAWCVAGARAGKAYADAHHGDRAALKRISDYVWMRAQFAAQSAPVPTARAGAAGEPFDVFMVAYRERNAAENWARLKELAPEARLIDGVAGIETAIAACAAAARTPFFFQIDADNWMLDRFDFKTDFEPEADEAAFWFARNPVNGLEYAHGGIKLFSTETFRRKRKLTVDAPTSLGARNRFLQQVLSEHRFNTDPETAFSVAFRECAKLAVGMALGGLKSRALARDRLKVWCNRGETAAYGSWCIRGAREGSAYGLAHSRDEAALARINDYDWMRARFREKHVRRIVIP